MFLAEVQTANYELFWHSWVQVGIVAALLLLANTIRRKVPFLRRFLIPSALIAGFLGMGIKYAFSIPGVQIAGKEVVDAGYMRFITYHSLAIGFIALGLISANKSIKKDGRAVKSGLYIVSAYLIQGIFGVLLSVLVGALFVGSIIGNAPYAGILLPMGFGQGPGQAGNIGEMFQGLENHALEGGTAFGLSVAATGILVACVLGTILLNVLHRKGIVKRYGESETSAGQAKVNLEDMLVDKPDEIPVVESMDKFTVQIAFVLATYLITFGVISLVSYLVVDLLGASNLHSIIWGFNFLFAILVTIIVKVVVSRLRKKNIMKRTYLNNYMLNRIAGLSFDLMIATSIMSIDFGQLSDASVWVLLGLMAVVGTIITYFHTKILAKKYFPRTMWHTFFGFFGIFTGTASEGIALLREIDPKLESGVAEDIVNGSGTAAIFGAPMLLIIGFIHKDTASLWISFGLLIVLFIVIMLGLHFFTAYKEKQLAKEESISGSI